MLDDLLPYLKEIAVPVLQVLLVAVVIILVISAIERHGRPSDRGDKKDAGEGDRRGPDSQ